MDGRCWYQYLLDKGLEKDQTVSGSDTFGTVNLLQSLLVMIWIFLFLIVASQQLFLKLLLYVIIAIF